MGNGLGRQTRFRLPIVGLLAVVALAVFFAVMAHREPNGNDFWSVAVPGILTGVGTLALAGVTVWVSIGERARDDRLRAQQQEDLRAQTVQAQSAETARQARRVVLLFGHAAPGFTVRIVNAGTEPIFDVRLEECVWPPAEGQVSRLYWDTSGYLLDRWQPMVAAGGSWDPTGRWIEDGQLAQQPGAQSYELPKEVEDQMRMRVSWVDSWHNQWKRTGREDPVRVGAG